MKPTVGRTVHYHFGASRGLTRVVCPRAAVITYVFNDNMVNLYVFGQDGQDELHGHHTSVEFSETPKSGCWNWPPRE
jgi:hypothetical protein